VHVLFDESNSPLENSSQDEDFELGLTKKDCLQNHEEGKKQQTVQNQEPEQAQKQDM